MPPAHTRALAPRIGDRFLKTGSGTESKAGVAIIPGVGRRWKTQRRAAYRKLFDGGANATCACDNDSEIVREQLTLKN